MDKILEIKFYFFFFFFFYGNNQLKKSDKMHIKIICYLFFLF